MFYTVLEEARKLIATGVDPVQLKKAQKASRQEMAANTFEVIAREWHAKRQPSLSASHVNQINNRLQSYVFPYIGNHPIAELKATDYLSVLQRIEERGTIETAHITERIAMMQRWADYLDGLKVTND